MATNPSATLLVPEGWTRHDQGSLTELVAPEADLSLVIVGAREAPDARAAVAAAWVDYRGKETHPFKLEAPMPPGNGGWDELKQIVYQTSPAEHRTVAAYAARKGPVWSVAIIDGNNGTLEKRLGHINAILGSRHAPGHARENFSGRAAHRLDPARVAELVEFVRDSAATLGVPGVGLALIDHGEIVYEGGVGGARAGPARAGRRPHPLHGGLQHQGHGHAAAGAAGGPGQAGLGRSRHRGLSGVPVGQRRDHAAGPRAPPRQCVHRAAAQGL